MGNLASLAALAQASGAISSAGQGYSGYASNIAQGQFQGGIQDINARMAGLKENEAIARGDVMAERRGLQTQQEIGKQRVALAGNQVNVNTGSAANIQVDTAAAGAVDQATLRRDAALQAWGYGMEGVQDRLRGRVARISGRSAGNSSLISGGASFARGAAATGLYGAKAGWFDGADPTIYQRPPDGKNMSDPRNR